MQWQFCNYFKNHLHLTACRRRHAGGHRRSFFAAFPRAGTSPSPWRLRCALSQPGELIPAINSHSSRRRSHSSPLLCSATVVLRRSPLPQPCIPCQNWPRHKFRFSLVHLLEPAAVPHRTGVGRAPSSSSRPASAPPSSIAPSPELSGRFLLQPDSIRASW